MSGSVYINSKIDNKRYCKTNGQFTKHLRNNNITYKDYYEIYISGITPLCKCMKPLTFTQWSETYAGSCGNPICVGKNVSITKQNWSEEQRQRDRLNKQQAAASRSEEDILEQQRKTKEICLQRYGKEWATQSDEFKDKVKATKLKKYGNEYYSGWEKSSMTNRSKTIEEKNKINDKRRQTNFALYGVENPLLSVENLHKSALSNNKGKEYVLPSGKVIGVRGYENIVLDKLLEFLDESDIRNDNRMICRKYGLPIFEYVNVNMHRWKYYPDFYIEKHNLIIEVKSQWWWDGNGDEKYKTRLLNNLKKRESVVNKGYRFQLWLFGSKFDYNILENDNDFQREYEKIKGYDPQWVSGF